MKEFDRSDFDILNRVAPSGIINGAIDLEVYWFHAIAKCDAAFFQSIKMHKHKFFELHFILGGSITYITADKEITLKSGEYVLFAPGQSHKIVSYTQALIKCSTAFTVGRSEELYEALVLNSMSANIITENTYEGIRFISSVSEKQTPYYGIVVKNRLFEIIHGIAGDLTSKRRKDIHSGLIDGKDMRVFKAKQFVKDNPHVFLSCDYIASYCDLSVKQLNRLFLKHEGVSLIGYIHASKIEQAKSLLIESNSSLREISDDLGFSSVYYFSRFFLKHSGVTPGEFRNSNA